MSLRVEFLSGADSDLQDVFNIYEDYQEGFGVEFLAGVEAYLVRIAAFPEIAPTSGPSGARSSAGLHTASSTKLTPRAF